MTTNGFSIFSRNAKLHDFFTRIVYYKVYAQNITRIDDVFDAHAGFGVRHGVLSDAVCAGGGAEALSSK